MSYPPDHYQGQYRPAPPQASNPHAPIPHAPIPHAPQNHAPHPNGGHPAASQQHVASHTHGGYRHGPANPRPPQPRPQARATDSSYTLTHGGHRIRIKPVAFWVFVGSLSVMAVWTATTATYFAFKDDVLTRLIARQADMQFAYEDRIAELRALVDRTTSRQLLDQEQFEQKLGDILKRQSTLEQRAGALSALPDAQLVTGSIRPQAAISPATPAPQQTRAAITDTAVFTAPSGREARLESRNYALAGDEAAQGDAPGMGSVVRKLQLSLDNVEKRQMLALGAVEDNIEQRAKRMRSLFDDLGLDPGKLEGSGTRANVGGPFIPAKLSNASDFERRLYRIHQGRVSVAKLQDKLSVVPFRKPVLGTLDLSSGFGYRSDPFYGRPALHSGLDFRGDTGDPVRATAGGEVETAGWSGGYGKMVEIDHGNGLSTRYGHMSEIKVKVGDKVQPGQIIGAIGSTGRSTGPHLHYETRINGSAVNPQKFLRAGLRMGGA